MCVFCFVTPPRGQPLAVLGRFISIQMCNATTAVYTLRSVSVSFSVCLCLCRTLFFSLTVPVSVSVCVCLCMSFCLTLFLTLSVFVLMSACLVCIMYACLPILFFSLFLSPLDSFLGFSQTTSSTNSLTDKC